MIASSVAAVLFSLACLGVLAWRDPKRLRNLARDTHTPALRERSLRDGPRRLLGWLVLAPAPVLIVAGEWWAFLVWVGVMCTAGWMAAQMLAIRSSARAARD